jgi:hypothetical protein
MHYLGSSHKLFCFFKGAQMQEQSRNVYFEMWSELHRTNHAASSKLLNVDKEIGFMEVHIGVAAIEAELRAGFQPKRFSLRSPWPNMPTDCPCIGRKRSTRVMVAAQP